MEETLNGRERILHEAARLFVEQGYNGISMREIGEASGMTKAALYYHFKDKQDLLREIIRTSLGKTQTQFMQKPETDESFRNQISRLVKLIFHQEPGERGILHLIFVEAPHLEEDLRREITCIYHDQFLTVLENLLQSGVEQGEFSIDHPRVAARLLLGMMYPFIHPRHTETQKDTQTTVETILTVFFDGVSK